MICEICGSSIRGPTNYIIVEGARLVACTRCSTHGDDYWKPVTPSKSRKGPVHRIIKPKPRTFPTSVQRDYSELELRDNYASQIRRLREKRGLTQEELAKSANERLSIIQKIELGKMIPDIGLSKTLEHILKMKLMIPRKEPIPPKSVMSTDQELTIGDIIQLKKKKSTS